MVPVCWLCRGRAQQKSNGLCQDFRLGESPGQAMPFLPVCPWRLLSCCESQEVYAWALEEESLGLRQPSVSLSHNRPGFHRQELWGLLFLVLKP